MNLHKLINNYKWFNIKQVLIALYPSENDYIKEYKSVYEKLKGLNPVSTDIVIILEHQKDEFDGEEYVGVYGKYSNPRNEDEKHSQALELTPWNEWLGMTICKESFIQFSDLDIIAHCLHEMTFFGFEEEKIKVVINKLEKSIEEFENMTEEEKTANTTSMEELLNRFKVDKNN